MTAPSLHRSSTRLSRRSLGLGAAAAVAGLALTACGSSNALSRRAPTSTAAAAARLMPGRRLGEQDPYRRRRELHRDARARSSSTGSCSRRTATRSRTSRSRTARSTSRRSSRARSTSSPTTPRAWRTGSTQQVNGANAKSIATNDATQTVSAMQPLLQQKGLTALKPSAATDQNAFAVTKKFAQDEQPHDAVRPGEAGQADQAGGARGVPQAAELPDRPGEDLRAEDRPGAAARLRHPQAQAGRPHRQGRRRRDGHDRRDPGRPGLVLLQDDKNLQEAENIVPGGEHAEGGQRPRSRRCSTSCRQR